MEDPGHDIVDLERDRRARSVWWILLAGPAIWLSHFMLVYLVAEVWCALAGVGRQLRDPWVPLVVTSVATGLAAFASALAIFWALRSWRHARAGGSAAEGQGGAGEDLRGSVSLAGLLLAALSFVGVLFVGLPALVLPAC